MNQRSSIKTNDNSKIRTLLKFLCASIDNECCNVTAIEHILTILCLLIDYNDLKKDVYNQINKILMTNNARHAIRFLLGILKEQYTIIITSRHSAGKKDFEYSYRLSGTFSTTLSKTILETLWSKKETIENNEAIAKLQLKIKDELSGGAIFLLTVLITLTFSMLH